MTPKEKAEELVLKFLRIDNNTSKWFNTHIAKQCALIAVDEIIKEYEEKIIYAAYDTDFELWKDSQSYWKEVKQEINLL